MDMPHIRTVDVLWSGQTRCYDHNGNSVACSGSGQDAETRCGREWPEPRFETRGDVVLDRLTDLVWLRHAAPAEYPLTWHEALDYVAVLNRQAASGYSGWRLPNRRELRSLISHQTRRPALPEGHPFREVFSGGYWSSTTAVISPAHAWTVDMGGGRMFYGGKDQSFMVWPVRGRSTVLPVTGQSRCYDERGAVMNCAGSGQDAEYATGVAWPQPRFMAHGDTVEDRLTGLVWRCEASLGEVTDWSGALAAVARLGVAWCLPTINELESLVDCAHYSPAFPTGHPFQRIGDVCWSSTTSAYEPDWAWALYVDKGAVGVGQKQQARFHVWAVSRN